MPTSSTPAGTTAWSLSRAGPTARLHVTTSTAFNREVSPLPPNWVSPTFNQAAPSPIYPPPVPDNARAWNGQLPGGQTPNGVAAGVPAHQTPTGPGPNVSGRTAPPRMQPVKPEGSPSLPKSRVPEYGPDVQPLKDTLLKNQRGSWLTRFLFPEEASAVEEEKSPSTEPVADLKTSKSAYQSETRSPDRPRAPVAPMYEGDPLPNVPDYQAHPGDTIRAEESSSEDSEDDGSDTAVITTESASDSSSTLGQESLNGSGEDGNEGSSYSDGVIDVQPKKYFGTTAGSIDINNSLHISSGGKFHLGPQWHVPDAGTAHSNAGPKLGPVSVFSSWSTNEFDVEEDPSTPRRDSNDMEGSFCGQYNTAASPTTPVGSDCYNIDSPEGTGSHENQFSTVVEKINDMDLSMTGAC
ncbi:hypothetical protein F5B17DRAFT_450709 [Nemania serpens]|nr:hypothetical protein F5B17DRAFT_450709 [Nemania serpens]